MAVKTIVAKGKGHHDEVVCGAATYPGEVVEAQADGKYDPMVSPAAGAVNLPLVIAKEDALQGRTINDAYADGDLMFTYRPLVGDRINCYVAAGEDVNVNDYLRIEGGGSGKFVSASEQVAYNIALNQMRVHDAMATPLPAVAANDDMGLVTGTPGTDAPTLQGVDFGATSTDEKAAFEYELPANYRAGDSLSVRLRAAMLTTVSDGTATVDVEAWKTDGDGAVGSDLCATAAQSINSLTPANLDFTITPTGLEPGDKLIIRLSFAGSDTGNAGVMIPEISQVKMLVDTALNPKVKAVEDSGGVLASATHVLCEVV